MSRRLARACRAALGPVRRSSAVVLPVVALLAATGGTPQAAGPLTPTPTNLEVLGGPGWHPFDDFSVRWDDEPSRNLKLQVIRTHYAIYEGTRLIEEQTVPSDPNLINHIQVPAKPSSYTVEIWLETANGPGERASVALNFDDERSAAASILAPAGWRGAGDPAGVTLEPAADPPPLSGLRGYAVSLNRGAAHPPCDDDRICTAAETDVGLDTRALSFGILPEGVYTVGLYTVSGSGVHSDLATATLRIDSSRPDVTLASLPDGWSSRPLALTAVASDPLSGMAPAGPEGPFTAIAVDGGLPKRAPGATVATVVSGDGVHTVALWGRDAKGNSGEPGVSLAAPTTATVRIDGTGPEVTFARAQDPADPERIEATVADSLAGPDPTRGAIGVRPAGGDRAFEPLPTTVAGSHLSARWSSDDYPPGRYEFRATGFDRAGNSTAAVSRADGSAMVLPAPLKAPISLEFGFGDRRLVWQRCARSGGGRRCHRQVLESFSRRPAARTLPCGHGITVGGRLLSTAGAPLRGRPVEVVETFDDGARVRTRRTAVRSRADGSFATRLGAGPSRRVSVTFAGDRVLSRAAGRELRLAVRTGVGLRVSTSRVTIGGSPVVFSGRIAHPEAPIPHAGLPVELQFRLPGRPWEEFRTLQTDAAGRFRYPYAFTDDDSAGVRFLFRAHAPPSGGWPFLPGTSRPLAVTGG